MCGIAGIVMKNGQAPDPGVLDAFARSLAHRGPDGSHIWADGATGLVHTRLSIIDLAGGDQPLFGDDGSVLVGNGEIYNYVELRADQEAGGVSFRTRADFEPAQNRLTGGRADATADWRGMYAAAVLWPDDGRLVLARDPFGIKPLYTLDRPDLLAFASEPRAFFAAGLATPELDETRVTEVLQRQYSVGPRTVYRGIDRLAPGGVRTYRDGGLEAEIENDWRPAPAEAPADLDAAVAAFDRAFEESVAIHQRSDVPYGMFLSGGLDSTALLTMMARLNDRPVRTFTCAFPGTRVHDERHAARKAATAFGAEHTEITFDETDFWSLLPRIVDAFDEPTADYAILPTWKLGQTSAERVKVVLSGEGGDEILGGYGRYRKLMRPWWLGGKAPRVKGALDGLGILRDDGKAWAEAPTALAHAAAQQDGYSRLQAAQSVDIDGWLPADLLLKLDRSLMAHGVEGRTPFLDPAVAAAGFTLPDDMKVRDNLGKWVLRAWLTRHCAETDAFARKKGFTVPVGDWIAKRATEAGEAVAANPGIAERCHPDAVRGLFRDGLEKRSQAAWSLLFFAVWHRRHVEGAALTGDALDFLSG